jgi:hypothetical protein
VEWSENCKTINTEIFSLSGEFNRLSYSEKLKLWAKNDIYALETFVIPKGVTTIKPRVFEAGFGNVKSITVPVSVTTIGSDAFKSISEVIYEK